MGASASSLHPEASVIKSTNECRIETTSSDEVISSIWFSSPPIKRSVLRRLKSIQLVTVGYIEHTGRGRSAASWYEIAICRPSAPLEPRINLAANTQLTWRSHNNPLVPTDARCEGQVFPASHPLIKELEAGDSIAVRICVHHGPVASRGIKGQIIFNSEDEKNDWPELNPTTYSLHSFSATEPLSVEATGHYEAAKLWFSTPPLDQEYISKIAEIQLFTKSKDQGWVDDPESVSFSWFELAIQPSPKDQLPVLREGCYTSWHSHRNIVASKHFSIRSGQIFGHTDEICRLLRPGDSIGVRVVSQFGCWANHAAEGQLEIRFSSPLTQRKGQTQMRNITPRQMFSG